MEYRYIVLQKNSPRSQQLAVIGMCMMVKTFDAMLDSCCSPLYADIIKGVIWHYAYTTMYNVKHHVNFFIKRDGKAIGIPCAMPMF